MVTADNQGNAYAEGLRKYQGASATPDQLPDMMYLEDTMLGELVDKGQVLPAEACMEADGYDLTQLTPVGPRGLLRRRRALARLHERVDADPLLQQGPLPEGRARPRTSRRPRWPRSQEYAQKIKDAGVAPKPMAFLANEWFFDTWAAGVGQDVVDNDNGRSEVAHRGHLRHAGDAGRPRVAGRHERDGLLNPFAVTDGSIDHYLALVTEQSSMLIETSTASGTIAQVLGGDLTAARGRDRLRRRSIDTTKVVPASGRAARHRGAGQGLRLGRRRSTS